MIIDGEFGNKELNKTVLSEKLDALRAYIASLGSLAIGFSGGVDSAFLLAVAAQVLGDRALAVTEAGPAVPKREVEEAKRFCEERGIRQIVFRADVFGEENYRHNAPDRCYHCKRALFTEIGRIAAENGIEYLAEGSNIDDLGDYRPGLKAVAELSVTSPLREAGLCKKDIRALSKAIGLETWDKPSYACLASRIAYGEEITPEKLLMIDRAEQFLIDRGFPEVRVRLHGQLARIEVPGGRIAQLAESPQKEEIVDEFKRIGFKYVTLDLKGYVMGSMNAMLNK